MASSANVQDESNSALWLATRADKMELSFPLEATCRAPKKFFPLEPFNKLFIDQACSVKMAGYWPPFFANIQSSWPHTRSITHIYFRFEDRSLPVFLCPVY